MGTYIKYVTIIIAIFVTYNALQGNYTASKTTDNTQASYPSSQPVNQASKRDSQAFQNHLNTLGPRLQNMSSGTHNFVAPDGHKYSYQVNKSNLFYCPRQKKKIYGNISLRIIDQ